MAGPSASSHSSGTSADERERPPRRAGGNARDSDDAAREGDEQVEGERRTRPQAQSRHSIFFLSASWLRCLTRKQRLQVNSVAWIGHDAGLQRLRELLLAGEGAPRVSSSSASSSSTAASCFTSRSWIDSTSAAGRRVGRHGGVGELRLARLGVLQLFFGDVFVLGRLFDVVHGVRSCSVTSGARVASVARGLYSRVMTDATRQPRHERRQLPAHSRHRDRARRATPTTDTEMTQMRTQEAFGAATPGRRVLYSASWVLVRLRRGGDANRKVRRAREAGQGRAAERVTNETRERQRLGGVDLTTERDGEDRRRAPSSAGASNGSAS